MPFTTNGAVRLHYEVQGEGETLVLSSGLGGTGHHWTPHLKFLTERFRVVTYDHAGSGQSTRPVGARSVADFAADMAAVIRASGAERAHVMGHAIGGMTGLQLAIDAPQLLRSLTIVNGWGAPNPHIARCFSVRGKLLRTAGVDAYVEAQPLFLYPATWLSDHDADLRRNATRMPDHMPLPEDLLARIAAFRDFAPADAALARIETPVLCLATKDDMLVPWTCSRDLAARLGHGSFKLLPWGGHASSHCDPAAFEAALDAFYQEHLGELAQ